MQSSYTARLARFAHGARGEDLPAGALHAGRRLIKDTIGCVVAGMALPSSRIVAKVIQGYGGASQASVLVSGKRLPAALAAHVNGHAANAIDADDTYKYKAHLAAAIVPAALAIAEWQRSSGRDLLSAVIVGFEVAGRIGMSLKGMQIGPDGQLQFAPVSGYSWSAFGATVAAGRLLALDGAQMLHAINITASSLPVAASGKFGETLPRPMTKYAMYGTIAQCGINAALLAQEGFTGEPAMLDGDKGLWRMLGSLGVDNEQLVQGLGASWGVEGVAYKPYPGCRFGGSAVDMLLALKDVHGFQAADIEQVEVFVHGAALAKKLDSPRVETMVDACFSIPYMLGAALFAGKPGPDWHTPEARANPAIRAFGERVKVGVAPTSGPVAREDLERLGYNARMPAAVRVHVRGEVFEASADYAHGDPYTAQTVMTDAQMNTKFADFCEKELSPAQIRLALDQLDTLDSLSDLTGLMASLVRAS